MERVKVGVIGLHRGKDFIKYCTKANNAELVAICDSWKDGLQRMKEEIADDRITYYNDYDEFLKHDMDVVVLANYANQHAPFAVKAMKAGHHVISEVLPCQCLKEAVELIETVESTGKIYCYAENYCYMTAPREMRRLYRLGEIGEIEYAEGDYAHENEHICVGNTLSDPKHWRNNSYPTFYCTHSIGPILHICGLRPVKVTGFELPNTPSMRRMGQTTGAGGIEMIELENGAVLRSFHGNVHATSIRYTVFGSKGRLMSDPNLPESVYATKMYLESYAQEGHYDEMKLDYYEAKDELSEVASHFSFSGADFYTMWNALEKIKGNPAADTIDVYEALDMFLPGLLAHVSVMNGGIPVDIPNLRDPQQREKYRNNTACCDPAVAGDQLMGRIEGSKIDPEVADNIHERFMAGHTGLRDGKIGYVNYEMPLHTDHPYRKIK